jgi:hypothetical protein
VEEKVETGLKEWISRSRHIVEVCEGVCGGVWIEISGKIAQDYLNNAMQSHCRGGGICFSAATSGLFTC